MTKGAKIDSIRASIRGLGMECPIKPAQNVTTDEKLFALHLLFGTLSKIKGDQPIEFDGNKFIISSYLGHILINHLETTIVESEEEEHQPHPGMCDLSNPICFRHVDEAIARGEA